MKRISIKTCYIEVNRIDSEGFVIEGDLDNTVKVLDVYDNKEIKFLPEKIAEKFPALEGYNVCYCAISEVKEKHFKNLQKLKILILESNEINSIASNSFKDLIKLERLYLKDNKIKVLEPKLLGSLKNLLKISVEANRIEELDENIFQNATNLKIIDVENNNLTSIPNNLFKNNLKLNSIYLKNNRIESISSSTFDHLPNLFFVTLEKNVCINQLYFDKPALSDIESKYWLVLLDHGEISDIKRDLRASECTTLESTQVKWQML